MWATKKEEKRQRDAKQCAIFKHRFLWTCLFSHFPILNHHSHHNICKLVCCLHLATLGFQFSWEPPPHIWLFFKRKKKQNKTTLMLRSLDYMPLSTWCSLITVLFSFKCESGMTLFDLWEQQTHRNDSFQVHFILMFC